MQAGYGVTGTYVVFLSLIFIFGAVVCQFISVQLGSGFPVTYPFQFLTLPLLFIGIPFFLLGTVILELGSRESRRVQRVKIEGYPQAQPVEQVQTETKLQETNMPDLTPKDRRVGSSPPRSDYITHTPSETVASSQSASEGTPQVAELTVQSSAVTGYLALTCCLISGVIGCAGLLGVINGLPSLNSATSLLVFVAVFGLLGFGVGLAGGIYAFKRSNFAVIIMGLGLDLFAGVLSALLGSGTFTVLGLPILLLTIAGITLASIQRKEFR